MNYSDLSHGGPIEPPTWEEYQIDLDRALADEEYLAMYREALENEDGNDDSTETTL